MPTIGNGRPFAGSGGPASAAAVACGRRVGGASPRLAFLFAGRAGAVTNAPSANRPGRSDLNGGGAGEATHRREDLLDPSRESKSRWPAGPD